MRVSSPNLVRRESKIEVPLGGGRDLPELQKLPVSPKRGSVLIRDHKR